MDISERSFEDRIVQDLLEGGPDGTGRVGESEEAYGDLVSGGYRRREQEDYDRERCLIPRDALDFVLATQPKEWAKLKQYHGDNVNALFLKRLSAEVARRGTLDVLRKGIKDSGCKFRLAYFKPSSGLNEELRLLHQANVFSVLRQLHYSPRTEQSVDLALFLNGLPIFLAELKNPLTGQNVEHAVRQFRYDRDPKEPLFAFGRCLAFFAVDPDLAFVATHLLGAATQFLPFNQGKYGGAGNPPVLEGYATAYLWKRIWARDSVLNLVQQFAHVVEEEDDKGRKTGKRTLIFPRYHQLDSVRRLVADAKAKGPGEHYLIQHSAGSGKSNSIAWLAHQLSVLHDDADERVFDSILVITDRRVLDRQLQRTVRQFEQTLGVVENIDQTSRQLKEALESGKTIIVTTLQKFPVIAAQVQDLPGKRFALIIDEAHSSQSGESTKDMKSVFAVGNLEEAEAEDAQGREDADDRVVAEMKKRGRQANVSTFAFTATPKPKTLEMFGKRRPDGRYEPFSIYSMRQAIEEGFILDVLENYTTYKVYWKLLKKIEDDPHYDRKKATFLLRSFVDVHPHAIDKKVAIMVDHFATQVAQRIGGRAKAMIVTRSRLHAVRYKLAVDKYLREKGYPYKALVAFSGTVRDGGQDFTEAKMNGLPETQTAKAFGRDEYQFMVVAYKFQTGFDQPLLHTMYVDKKLAGVHAVQTLSRLNRTIPGEKDETMVLDFSNEAEEIQKAFEPYYERTILSEGTDPNQLYDLEGRLEAMGIYTPEEVENVARIYFDPKGTQGQVYGALAAPVDRFRDASEDAQTAFRGALNDYVRLYAFLAQIIQFADADLEKLYQFGRRLARLIVGDRDTLPRDIQNKIDMDSYEARNQGRRNMSLRRGPGILEPTKATGEHTTPGEELEPLSQIIKELNERFGYNLGESGRAAVEQLCERVATDETIASSLRVNTPDNARLTFDQVVTDHLQDMVDTNFDLYKRITDDEAFGKAFLDWLFDQARRQADRRATG